VRTRTLTAVALAAVVAAPLAATASTATTPGTEVQKISGTVAVPNPIKAAASVTRHNRSAGLLAAETNGVVGWFFKVDPKTWGGEFAVTTTTAGSDFDIIFYADPGNLTTGAAAAAAEFYGTDGDGEAGVIPTGATHAVLYPTALPNAAFTYTGRAPVEIAIGTGSLDATVRSGSTVTWVNRTSDYAFVDGGKAFGAPLAQGKGIPVGGTFSTTLSKVGKFVYSTPAGTGTITVVG
jgi:hypothetical protein